MDEKSKQIGLFKDINVEEDDLWRDEWEGMPEYNQKRGQGPWKSLQINFEKREDMDAFSKLINQKLTEDTISIWYPKKEIYWRTKAFYYEP